MKKTSYEFPIDNKSAVKRLAASSLKSDRVRRWISILTIALSVCLLLSVALVLNGAEEKHKATQSGKAQVTMAITDDNQIKQLRNLPDVEWAGIHAALGFSYQKDITLNIVYEDQTQLKNQKRISFTGEFPTADDEIMLPENYIHYLKKDIKPGDTVSLDLTGLGQKRTYRVTGIVNSSNETDSYLVWVSEKCAQTLMGKKPVPRVAYTRMNTNSVDMNELDEQGVDLAQKCGAPEQSVQVISDYYAVMSGGDSQGVTPTLIPIGLAVLILGGIVIYSIFYASVSKNVRSYGQLRTIGMTKKQVKKMVRLEGRKLMLYGIPAGLVAGFIIGYSTNPAGFNAKKAIMYALAVSIFAFFTTRISMHAPVKIASNTSPLAGLLYIQYQGKQKSTKKERRSLTPVHLALMNLGRSKRKTIITTAMLALSGILLLTVSTVTKSLSPEKMDRFYMFPYGDIQLTIQEISRSSFADNKEEYRSSRLQQQDNPLNNTLITKIRAIDGVNSVTSESGVRMGIFYQTGIGMQGSSDLVSCLTKEQCDKIVPSIVAGTCDYNILTKKNGILLRSGLTNIKPGETAKISGRGLDGKSFSKEMPVVGIYDKNKQQELCPLSTGADFLMTDASVEKLTGIKDQAGILSVSIDPAKMEQATSEIKAIADANDQIDMLTLEESVQSSQAWFDYKTRPLSLIALIILLFGIVSLINTTLTNFTARKHEFALLQSVGMTKKQLQQMLRTENVFFAFATIILTLVLGSIGGLGMCFHLERTMHCIQYQFPMLITAAFISALLVAEFILTVCTAFMVGNDSLVERLRAAE